MRWQVRWIHLKNQKIPPYDRQIFRELNVFINTDKKYINGEIKKISNKGSIP
ncbi:hypothetical protein PM10SUCC1_29210 [Propionigenium maris DSM 9537]|uniref:Uncharacterized protein n=1 Tax=Propionigenium maris DSM 9537 TaxID=1123000 RepID=A0A9W6LPB4_9FUSO|nr:hypothetical protein PM10SUCC1_29210 [Propionigenium maris DSM 9537]